MKLPRALAAAGLLAGALAGCATHIEQRTASGALVRSGELVLGQQQGAWTYYHPNGAKQSEGRYENDVQVGAWTWWYPDGALEMQGEFERERRVGVWSFHHPNGALRARGEFADGFESGEWSFFDESGALERRGDYDRGAPALVWSQFAPDGTELARGWYLAGVKVGTWTVRAADGSSARLSFPRPAGWAPIEELDSDGTPRRRGALRDGRLDGLWVSFHPNGARRATARFERGVPEGEFRAFDPQGQLLARGSLRRGCVAGPWDVRAGAGLQRIDVRPPRPPAVAATVWSAADPADAQTPLITAERWIAELAAPVQAQPEPEPEPAAAVATSVAAPAAPPPLPAKAQPWTERELGVLSRLVSFYGTGPQAGRWELGSSDGYERVAPLGPPAESEPPRATSDTLEGRSLPITRFRTADGGELDLATLAGRKPLVLAIQRGFGGQVCVYCAAQTKALARAARDFAELEAEVLVVYPGPESGVKAFLEAYERTFGPGERPPYRILYDTDLALTRALGLLDNVAVPASLVLDRGGRIRWSHVARNLADRPSAQELLEQLRKLDPPRN